MIAAVIFSLAETVGVSAPSSVFGKATTAAAIRESSKKRRRVGVIMVGCIRSFDGASAMGRTQAGVSPSFQNQPKPCPNRWFWLIIKLYI
jgi:hypothetical protein